MKNFRVMVLRDRNNPSSKMIVNIQATSRSEARQKALMMYGPQGRVVSVV